MGKTTPQLIYSACSGVWSCLVCSCFSHHTNYLHSTMCFHVSSQRHYCWMYESGWLSLTSRSSQHTCISIKGLFHLLTRALQTTKVILQCSMVLTNNSSQREPCMDQTVCDIRENIFAGEGTADLQSRF